MTRENENGLTGYPSIDKPWLKYYSREAINAPLPKITLYQYAWENNKNDLGDTTFRYFGTKITYWQFFERVKNTARSFAAMGVGAGDIVTIMSMHTPETIYALYALKLSRRGRKYGLYDAFRKGNCPHNRVYGVKAVSGA